MSFLHSENIWRGSGHAGDGPAWDLRRGEKLSEFFEFFEFFEILDPHQKNSKTFLSIVNRSPKAQYWPPQNPHV